MRRLLNEYVTTFDDNTSRFERYLSDNAITRASSEGALGDNQYFKKFRDYFVMQSDGTKRCGFIIDLTNKILIGDYVEVDVEMRSVNGDKPAIIYEEFTSTNNFQYDKKEVKSAGHFEHIHYKQYVNNRFGSSNGRVFVGLEVGQSGKFMFRFPTIIHHAQIPYTHGELEPHKQFFQIVKTSGTWSLNSTTSYRKLDSGSVSIGALYTLVLTLDRPFESDVPMIFFSTNKEMAGYTVHHDYVAKELVTIRVFDSAGAPVDLNTISDGARIDLFVYATLNQ